MSFWTITDNSTLAVDNITIDNLRCFEHFNFPLCYGQFLILLLIGSVFCISLFRLSYILFTTQNNFYHHLILYISILQHLSIFIRDIWKQNEHIFEVLSGFFKVFQLMLILQYHVIRGGQAMTITRILRRLFLPSTVVTLIYIVLFDSFRRVSVNVPSMSCISSNWLVVAAAEFVIVQLALIPFYIIFKEFKSMYSQQAEITRQKISISCVMIVYEIYVFWNLAYEVKALLVAKIGKDCAQIYELYQTLHSPNYYLYSLCKYFGTTWAIWLFITPPSPLSQDEDESLLENNVISHRPWTRKPEDAV